MNRHRDVKPENVMFDSKTRRVKLLDFGIATDTQASSDERLTRAGFFVGTLMYIAPEALSGEIVTAAADQYSLATIAYFLLTRSLPYSAKAPREMFTQLLTMPRSRSRMQRRGFTSRRRGCCRYAFASRNRSPAIPVLRSRMRLQRPDHRTNQPKI